jgi:enoyl-CoA hydratase/carnithine racemase
MKELKLTIDGPVAKVVIDRPSDSNRVSPEFFAELKDVVARLKVNRDVHVLGLRGAGSEIFSMGVFGPVRRAQLTKEQALEAIALANEVIDDMEALPQIVVAGINGAIRGGGGELALGCDFRVTAAHARLSFPEAKLGGFPGASGAVRLPATVGYSRAIELLSTGREIDTAEMLRIGFVERVIESDRFDAEFDALLATVGSCSPLGIRGAKRVANVRREPGFRGSRQLSDALRAALEYTSDMDEGLAAHREHRAPKFTGR